jgi:hypothetical protein
MENEKEQKNLEYFSKAGDYFEDPIESSDGTLVRKCKLCTEKENFLKIKGGNTSGMIKHLMSSKHNMLPLEDSMKTEKSEKSHTKSKRTFITSHQKIVSVSVSKTCFYEYPSSI